MIRLGRWAISAEAPCFVIAEAGVNHNGDVSLAEELVRQAKAAGADCVKFQTFTPSELVTRSAPKAAYQLENTDPRESQLAMLEKLRLPRDAFRRLRDLCGSLDIAFLSTPYTFSDIDFLDSIGVDAFKIASAQLVEPVFLRHAAAKGRPIILSTGMGDTAEVGAAVAAVRSTGNGDLVLLQCTTNYPAAAGDANLRAIPTLASEFDCLAGYSDHTTDPAVCLGALALGARVIEKHFTLDKALPGPDHACSADPGEFRLLVRSLRALESALGDGVKAPVPSERRNAEAMRRSIVAARRIGAGERLTADMLALKRPATGIPAAEWDEVIGRRVLRDLDEDTILTRDSLADA